MASTITPQSSIQQLHHIVLITHQYNDVEYFVAHLLGNNGLHPVLLSHSPFRQPVYGIDLHSDHLPVIHNLSCCFTTSV
jgi:hypothetical protein